MERSEYEERFKEEIAEMERLRQDPATELMAISIEINIKDQIQREYDAWRKGYEEGKRLGAAQETILNMHKAKMTAEDIARFAEITVSDVKEIIESATRE